MSDRFQLLRLVEALLFASAEPLGPDQIRRHLPEDADLDGLMTDLASLYANRGVTLVRLGARWALRTAPDLAGLMQIERAVVRKPSRAAVETLAIIAYHQPVTRAEIEEIRGVALSRGTLDTLLEAGWIKPKGRRRTPGRPVTWGTTEAFLDHFGLDSLEALPGVAELKAAGLLDTRPAIAALGAHGYLPAAGPAPGELAADDDLDQTEAELPLAADFGEHLVPGDGEPHDDDEDDPAMGGSGEIEVASPDDAAPALGKTDARPPKAAVAPGRDGR
ncbi:MAG: SMC-Scp complex subunit ScpB [Proteobacteria bacterium]|nr:SMC-Scp complex subunit ScpB [Pseudomonadota bacterium]